MDSDLPGNLKVQNAPAVNRFDRVFVFYIAATAVFLVILTLNLAHREFGLFENLHQHKLFGVFWAFAMGTYSVSSGYWFQRQSQAGKKGKNALFYFCSAVAACFYVIGVFLLIQFVTISTP